MRPIPGIPHAYATEEGEIFTDHPGNRWRGKLHKMKPSDNGRGYLRVMCGGRLQSVHKLVAAAYMGPAPEGKEVNHKDGDKQNNRPGNLEYVSRSENMRHANAHGLAPKRCGERHHNAKLSDKQVEELIDKYWILAVDGRLPDGVAQKLARKYGVHRDYPRILAIRGSRAA